MANLDKADVTNAESGVVHVNVDKLTYRTSAWGGREAVIYRSPDGTRVFGVYHEKGALKELTWPYDEYGYVLSGTLDVAVHNGPSFVLRKGDAFYFRKGTVADVEMSEDFSEIIVLESEEEIVYEERDPE